MEVAAPSTNTLFLIGEVKGVCKGNVNKTTSIGGTLLSIKYNRCT